MEITVRDVYNVINSFAPFVLQEDWDNSGLQIGSFKNCVSKVLLSLDITERAVEVAIEVGANLVISHHPLFFRPLKRLDFSDPLLSLLVENRINVISSHTPLDVVPDGVSFSLAEKLELDEVKILCQKTDSQYYKLIFYLPSGYEKKVLSSLFDEGVGEYHFYKDCAFETFGEGRYKEKSGANPFIKAENIFKESKVELIVRKDKLTSCLDKLKAVHPYQEVAFDVFQEAINPLNLGYGCVGVLKKTKKLSHFIEQCKAQLGLDNVRYVGDLNTKIKKVALCGGSGGSFVRDAIMSGADLYVTGDLKYHEVLENMNKIAFLDIGHRASELPVLQKLEFRIKEAFKKLKVYHFVEYKDFFCHY